MGFLERLQQNLRRRKCLKLMNRAAKTTDSENRRTIAKQVVTKVVQHPWFDLEPAFFEFLVPFLTDPDQEVRRKVACRLAWYRSQWKSQHVQFVSPLLTCLFESGSDEDLKAAREQVKRHFFQDEKFTWLFECLNSADGRTLQAVLGVLTDTLFYGSGRPREQYWPVIKGQANSSLGTARQVAATALGYMEKVPEAAAVAAALLKDPETSVRSAAAMALGSLDPSQHVAELLKCLEDPDASVRRNAQVSLHALVPDAGGQLGAMGERERNRRVLAAEAATLALVARASENKAPSLADDERISFLETVKVILDKTAAVDRRTGQGWSLHLYEKVRPTAERWHATERNSEVRGHLAKVFGLRQVEAPRSCEFHAGAADACTAPATWMFGPPDRPGQSVYCDAHKNKLELQHKLIFPTHQWQRLTAAAPAAGPGETRKPGPAVSKDALDKYMDVLNKLKPLTDFMKVLPTGRSEWRTIVEGIGQLVALGVPGNDEVKAACYYGLGKAFMCLGYLTEAQRIFTTALSAVPRTTVAYPELTMANSGISRMPPDVRQQFERLQSQLDSAARDKVQKAAAAIKYNSNSV